MAKTKVEVVENQSMGDIDVVIPTVLRRPKELARAVDSVLGQSLPPARVIIVVDSDDAELVCIDDERVTVIRNAGRHGAAAARNAGVRAATAGLVAFLDDDDYWLTDKLALQRRVLDCAPGPAVVAGRVQVLAPHRSWTSPDRPPRAGEALADFLFPTPGLRRSPNHSISTPTLLVPRQLLLEEPFDEDWRQWEDLEWLLRVTDASVELLWVPDVVAVIDQTRTTGESLSQVGNPESDLAWADRHLASRSARAWHNHRLTYAARGFASQGERVRAMGLVGAAVAQGHARPTLLAKSLAAVLVPRAAYDFIRNRRQR